MGGIQRLDNSFLSDPRAGQFNAQMISGGLGALAGGIKNRYDNEREDEKLKVANEFKRDAQDLAIIKETAKFDKPSAIKMLKEKAGSLAKFIDLDAYGENLNEESELTSELIKAMSNGDRYALGIAAAKLADKYPENKLISVANNFKPPVPMLEVSRNSAVDALEKKRI